MEADRSPRSSTPLSHRFADSVCAVLAIWTVLCHVAVVLEQSTRVLVTVTAIVALLWAGLPRWRARLSHRLRDAVDALRRLGGWRDGPRPEPQVGTLEDADAALVAGSIPEPSWWRWASIAIPLVLGVAVWFGLSTMPAWILGSLYLVLALVMELRSGRTWPATDVGERRWREGLVWGLALVSLIVTLAVSRPNLDDVFYLSMAVDVADYPDEPILARETAHGIPRLPIKHAGYRFHALEVLSGSLAFVTGIDVIYWAQWVLAGLAAILLVVALARALYRLTPLRWAWCLVTIMAIYLTIDGDVGGRGLGWYSDMSFYRLQQGKAILLSVFVPLIIAYGLEFARRPNRVTWRRLAFVQIAATGLSATSLWLVPTTAGLAVLAGASLRRDGWLRVVGTGAIASIYPAVLATALLFFIHLDAVPSARDGDLVSLPETTVEEAPEHMGMGPSGGFRLASWQPPDDQGAADEDDPVVEDTPDAASIEEALSDSEGATDLEDEQEEAVAEAGKVDSVSRRRARETSSGVERMEEARIYALGSSRLPWLVALAVALAWRLSPEPAARRYGLVATVCFFVVMFNPFTAGFLAHNVTGLATYWRVFWVLPAPILIALLLTLPLVSSLRWRGVPRSWAAARRVVTLAVIAYVVISIPIVPMWKRSKRYLAPKLELKVQDEYYEMAKIIRSLVPPKAPVLAPRGVSNWLVTLHHHPRPLSVRTYLLRFRNELGRHDINRRRSLTNMVTYAPRNFTKAGYLMQGVRKYGLQAVCLRRGLPWDENPGPWLAHRKFRKVYENRAYEIWILPQRDPLDIRTPPPAPEPLPGQLLPPTEGSPAA